MDIRNHIATHGLNRAEICKMAGIASSYLSMIESGERRIGSGKAAQFAEALGLTVADVRPDLAELFGTSKNEGAA